MQGPADETVGEKFTDELLLKARELTAIAIHDLRNHLEVGCTEAKLREQLENILALTPGYERNWHPPQIRIGANTVRAFGEPGIKDLTLKENDIVFFDIGPVFFGHEGDVGRSFAFGNDKNYVKCAADVKKIWDLVREHWQKTQATGPKLYDFAAKTAEQFGWVLSLKKANGHRIADFPHAAKARGSIEGFPDTPKINRWILEVQIQDPSGSYGAFHEDLLN